MDGKDPFPPAFLDWLDQVQERLLHLESDYAEEGSGLSRSIASELWRLRRECELLNRCLGVLVDSGQLRRGQGFRAGTLLVDLGWLLEVSPAASPAIARQCIRIARDRIQDEAQDFPDVPSGVGLRRIHSCAA